MLTKSPLFSIITVVFNSEDSIEDTVKSVLDQSFTSYEYIVIDGKSTDRTLQIVKKYENRISKIISEKDNGIYDAMNKGISIASGQYIGLLNADDTYHPDTLKIIAGYIEKSIEKNCVFFTNYFSKDTSLKLLKKHSSTLEYWKGMSMSHQSMFISKELHTVYGSYDLSFKYAADYEMLLRLIEKRVPFVKIDEYLITYNSAGTSHVNIPLVYQEALVVWNRYFPKFNGKKLVLLSKISKELFLHRLAGFLTKSKILNSAFNTVRRLFHLKSIYQ